MSLGFSATQYSINNDGGTKYKRASAFMEAVLGPL